MADYIDKQKTLNVIFEIAENVINSLPSADVQPVRHGKWVEEPNCMYRCSSCGSHYPSMRGYMDYCYCPSCGAKNQEI